MGQPTAEHEGGNPEDFETEQTLLWDDMSRLFYGGGEDNLAYATWSDQGMVAIVAGKRHDVKDGRDVLLQSTVNFHGYEHLSVSVTLNGTHLTVTMHKGRIVFAPGEIYTGEQIFDFCAQIRAIINDETTFAKEYSELCALKLWRYNEENGRNDINALDILGAYPELRTWLDAHVAEHPHIARH